MFNSGVILSRLNAGVRSPVAFFGINVRTTLVRNAAIRKLLSASVLRTVSNSKKTQNCMRCSRQTFAFSSRVSSASSSSEKQESHPKHDACINQSAQDFSDNNQEHDFQNQMQASVYYEQDKTDCHSSEASETKSSADPEIEDFGYHEYEEEEFEEDLPERCVPITLDRGQHGVFEVEEVVTLLEHENGLDIRVIDIPPEVRFVDHMVIVSGKSLRHMRAMAASIEWLYKQKRRRHDRQFKLEGRDCKDWLAVDMGNIAVHIFTPEARQHYDLETLWTLGPGHDDQRHYVDDDHLNLSAADLFWLESGLSEGPPKHGVEDVKGKGTVEHSDEKRDHKGAHLYAGSSRVQSTSNSALSSSDVD